MTATFTPKQELTKVNELLAGARRELGPLRAEAETATKKWADTKRGFEAMQDAQADVSDKEKEIKALDDKKVALLDKLPRGVAGRNGNGPRVGDATVGDGFALAAQELNLADGRTRVDMEARQLMRRPMATAGVTITPSSGLTAPAMEGAFVPLPADQRFLYPVFQQIPLDIGDLAITDFKATARSIEGEVERDPVATSEKAALGLSLSLETPPVRQFAGVAPEAPAKLFEAIPALEAYLQTELRYQLDKAIDAHVIAQIAAATPAHGKTGSDLIARVRNAVAAMRAVGANPTVLALNPTDAAALDLTKTELGYIFAVRDVGNSSPLFGLTVIENPRVTSPLLVDPATLGALYSQAGAVLIDPFTGMSTNTVRIRVEASALFHVRQAAGAYLIE